MQCQTSHGSFLCLCHRHHHRHYQKHQHQHQQHYFHLEWRQCYLTALSSISPTSERNPLSITGAPVVLCSDIRSETGLVVPCANSDPCPLHSLTYNTTIHFYTAIKHSALVGHFMGRAKEVLASSGVVCLSLSAEQYERWDICRLLELHGLALIALHPISSLLYPG